MIRESGSYRYEMNRKTVIFQFDHWAAITQYILLSVKNHRDDYRVLMTCRSLCSKNMMNIMDNLVQLGYFDKVIYVDELFPNARCTDKNEVRESIDRYYGDFLENNDIHVDKDTVCYTNTDIHGTFRVFLTNRKIPYIHVMLSDYDVFSVSKNTEAERIGLVSKEYMEVIAESRAFTGRSEFCSQILSFPSTVIPDNYKDIESKFHVFDVFDELTKSDKADKNNILKAFGFDVSAFENNEKAVVLTNSKGFLTPLISAGGYDGRDNNEFILLYQLLVDFYSGRSKLIIKPHPNIYGIEWEKFFPGSILIDKDTPIELLAAIDNIFIPESVSVFTSALTKIQKIVGIQKNAGKAYCTYYHDLIKLNVLLTAYTELVDLLFLNKTKLECFFAGYDDSFINSFVMNVLKDGISVSKDPNKKYTLYRFCTNAAIRNILNKPSSDRVMAIIKTQESFPFFIQDNNLLSYLTVIRIDKEREWEHCLLDTKTEYVYIFSKNKNVHIILQNLNINRKLECTGISYSARSLTQFEKEIYIETEKNKVLNSFTMKKLDLLYTVQRKDITINHMNTVQEYLSFIYLNKNLTAFVALRDNSGRYYSYGDIDAVKLLGSEYIWDEIGWNGYAAIIGEGMFQKEIAGQNGDEVLMSCESNGLKVEILSQPFKKGNRCSIKLNDTEYAVNSRGMNIVVYDNDKKQVVDSVCFDTFAEKSPCTRNRRFAAKDM